MCDPRGVTRGATWPRGDGRAGQEISMTTRVDGRTGIARRTGDPDGRNSKLKHTGFGRTGRKSLRGTGGAPILSLPHVGS
jgi:hypothetical protein